MKNLIIILIFIIILYIFLNRYILNKKIEPLCINPRSCGTFELENVLQYDWKTEPNNPFYTHEMVVPKLPEKYSGENTKLTYLNNANLIYSDIENDLLNAGLVPKFGMPFVYP
jgi:hypothetical protein